MSDPVVIDASALAAIIYGEPAGPALLPHVDGHPVHAPSLLRSEMANVALFKVRRNPTRTGDFIRAMTDALSPGAGIEWHEVDPADAALVAAATGLTAYDATYLCLAGQLGADLVTLDHQLLRAAATIDT